MIPGLVSIVIPSRNEKYTNKTVQDLLTKAKGDIEIIVTLDGWWPPINEISSDSRVKHVHYDVPRGMRNAINAAVAISQGEYILKIDAHCMVDEGYDVKLKADCNDNWVVVPRRHRLDPETWSLREVGKPPADYMYLTYPDNPGDWGGAGLHGREWTDRNKDPELQKVLIDDLMSSQGSFWFMKRSYYDFLELMDEENYGSFAQEFQEIGLKCWLSGGRVVINKKTWYAHWHKGKENGRGYNLDKKDLDKANKYTNRWFTEDSGLFYGDGPWHKQTLPFSDLIKKFAPIPLWEHYDKTGKTYKETK